MTPLAKINKAEAEVEAKIQEVEARFLEKYTEALQCWSYNILFKLQEVKYLPTSTTVTTIPVLRVMYTTILIHCLISFNLNDLVVVVVFNSSSCSSSSSNNSLGICSLLYSIL